MLYMLHQITKPLLKQNATMWLADSQSEADRCDSITRQTLCSEEGIGVIPKT